jgi:hypothetical protein
LDERAKEKKIKYSERIIEVEHGTFTPLVFSCFGGISRECGAFYKKLAEKIAEKRKIKTSDATRFNFSLIKSLILCIRGSRTIRDDICQVASTDIALINEISGARE